MPSRAKSAVRLSLINISESHTVQGSQKRYCSNLMALLFRT